jgi:hypothetical protein
MGLGTDLNKMSGKDGGVGLDNLGFGLGFLVAWAVAFSYVEIWWLNIFFLFFKITIDYSTACRIRSNYTSNS